METKAQIIENLTAITEQFIKLKNYIDIYLDSKREHNANVTKLNQQDIKNIAEAKSSTYNPLERIEDMFHHNYPDKYLFTQEQAITLLKLKIDSTKAYLDIQNHNYKTNASNTNHYYVSTCYKEIELILRILKYIENKINNNHVPKNQSKKNN